MSKNRKGRKLTEHHKNLISLATKGSKNPNFCNKLSESTKDSIRAARLGKSFLSEEIRNKMSKESGFPVRVTDLLSKNVCDYSSITHQRCGRQKEWEFLNLILHYD